MEAHNATNIKRIYSEWKKLKRSNKIALIVIACMGWWFAHLYQNYSRPPINEPSQARDASKEFAWVENMKDKVRARLKDPDSAIFSNTRLYRGFNNLPMVCGMVNAKNSFGGYSGKPRFIAAGDITMLEQDMTPVEFAKSWNELCQD